jgi:N-acetylglucosaminyldiphosphoundecaprenol N-acetyl-beta-D-mannosaminyltransferase
MENLSINNIKILSTTLDELSDLLNYYLCDSNSPALITTFNLDFLRITNEEIDFNILCKNSLYNLPDGFGLTSLLRKKYKRKVNRITGNDVFPMLIKIAAKQNFKIAIVGGTKVVSGLTYEKIIHEENFNSENLLCLAPPYLFEKDKKLNHQIINDLINFDPVIVFAALGCPRQEVWLAENMNKFNSKINIGIGATLDYYSEIKHRSPLFLQKIGLEWLWRLLNEPFRLFKRYVIKDLPLYFKMFFKKF